VPQLAHLRPTSSTGEPLVDQCAPLMMKDSEPQLWQACPFCIITLRTRIGGHGTGVRLVRPRARRRACEERRAPLVGGTPDGRPAGGPGAWRGTLGRDPARRRPDAGRIRHRLGRTRSPSEVTTGYLELARIGSQLFVFGSATCDQTAAPPLFDIFATRISAQPLSSAQLVASKVDPRYTTTCSSLVLWLWSAGSA
jgi:hypothetical protein